VARIFLKETQMPSEQQLQANRENAQFSTGPTSPTGKETSSRNALRHGLTATSIDHFPNEVRQEYGSFRDKLEAEMLPGSEIELVYFEHFAFAHFLALRSQALEVRSMQSALDNPGDEQALKQWRSTSRYARAHAKAAQQVLLTFREFQTDRYNAVLVQDAILHEHNSDIVVPYSAPVTAMLKPRARLHDNHQTGLCVIFAESKRLRHKNRTLQNEPNSDAPPEKDF
jgi:hypothetical protein